MADTIEFVQTVPSSITSEYARMHSVPNPKRIGEVIILLELLQTPIGILPVSQATKLCLTESRLHVELVWQLVEQSWTTLSEVGISFLRLRQIEQALDICGLRLSMAVACDLKRMSILALEENTTPDPP